jgi:hypothetical protein
MLGPTSPHDPRELDAQARFLSRRRSSVRDDRLGRTSSAACSMARASRCSSALVMLLGFVPGTALG